MTNPVAQQFTDDAQTNGYTGARVGFAEAIAQLPTTDHKRFITVFEHGNLSVEMYAPRNHDPQQPHTQDEVYVIVSGSGEFFCAGSQQAFSAGDFLFVPAGVEHRFINFTDNLAAWVIFYGAEGGEAGSSSNNFSLNP